MTPLRSVCAVIVLQPQRRASWPWVCRRVMGLVVNLALIGQHLGKKRHQGRVTSDRKKEAQGGWAYGCITLARASNRPVADAGKASGCAVAQPQLVEDGIEGSCCITVHGHPMQPSSLLPARVLPSSLRSRGGSSPCSAPKGRLRAAPVPAMPPLTCAAGGSLAGPGRDGGTGPFDRSREHSRAVFALGGTSCAAAFYWLRASPRGSRREGTAGDLTATSARLPATFHKMHLCDGAVQHSRWWLFVRFHI